jgi:hypothetical protein
VSPLRMPWVIGNPFLEFGVPGARRGCTVYGGLPQGVHPNRLAMRNGKVIQRRSHHGPNR